MRIAMGLVLLFLSLAASAWGPDGHRLVCQLAYEQLSDAGKVFVEDTLALGVALDGNGANNLAEACLWPDQARGENYRGSYEQHFINIPRIANKPDFLRDCAALDCIAVGIQRHLTYLSRPAEGEREQARKAAALRFLGHFLGDLYQPLHVGHEEDRGGNLINVIWFDEPMNLHQVWDRGIMARAGLTFPDALETLAAVNIESPPEDVLLALHQSFRLARSHAYAGISGRPVASGMTLGEAYFERSRPVVVEQLARSAAHLANMIEGIVAGTQDTNILVE